MLKRYDVPAAEPCSSRNIIVIDTGIGFFATVSDYGNYSYLWPDPGEEFRKFLTTAGTEYLYRKLTHVSDVFDAVATRKAIVAYLDERVGWGNYDLERKLLEDYDIDTERNFEDWVCNTSIEDWAEFHHRKPEPQCAQFCEKIFPIFQKMLVRELYDEAAANKLTDEQVAALRGAKPDILAASQAELAEVLRTGKY